MSFCYVGKFINKVHQTWRTLIEEEAAGPFLSSPSGISLETQDRI
jgi:hypothetical protein